MASDDTQIQIATLTETYRLLLGEGDITRAQLKAKLISAQAVMEDGGEINAVSFEGGNAAAVVLYPKQVVLAAALQVLKESDPNTTQGAYRGNIIHEDLSATRIET